MSAPSPQEPAPVGPSAAFPSIPAMHTNDDELSRRGSGRLLWGVGLLVVGLAGMTVRAAVLHDNLDFWRYVWLTLPVAGAGAFLGFRLTQGRGLGIGQLSGLVIGTLGTSYLTGLTGGANVSDSLFGGADINCVLQQGTDCAAAAATESPWQAAQRIATNYWELYGPAGIVSAVVAGAVVGIGFALVINRNLRRP
jgi:hypothetical protein